MRNRVLGDFQPARATLVCRGKSAAEKIVFPLPQTLIHHPCVEIGSATVFKSNFAVNSDPSSIYFLLFV